MMKWVVVLVVAAVKTVSAFAGNEVGNGGDSFALEFTNIGRHIVEEVRKRPDPRISESALVVAVETTDIVTQENLSLKGAEVDAINYPSRKRIELNRSRWKDYGWEQKSALVLHEYLGILGVDDSRYEISGKYKEFLTTHVAQDPAMVSVSEVAEPARKEYLGRFSLGVGSGYNSFGGNMGNLMGSTDPSFDVRLEYDLSSQLSLKAGFARIPFQFDAPPVGPASIEISSIGLAAQFHLVKGRSGRNRLGLDPYVLGGVDHVMRSQSFINFNSSQKDNAFGITGGLGSNFYFSSSQRVAIWVEGRISSIFFRDRYDDMFLQAGIEDTTGPLYSANIGLRFFF